MDHHFKNYTNIYNIYYINSKNQEMRLPLMRENGLVDWMNTSRQWRYWTFSTVGSNGDIRNVYPNLERIIAFWSHKNNIDMKNAKFRLKVKPIKVVYKWEKNLLKNNMNAPWKNAGTLGWKNGKFYANIIDIESKKD